MKPGDLTIGKKIPRNLGKCYRIYNVIGIDPTRMIYPEVVDKLYHGELAFVIETCDEKKRVRILTPRGIIGWILVDLLEVVE